MKSTTIRRVVRAAVVTAAAGVGALAMAGSALAAPASYNEATLNIEGGDARALSGCIQVAKTLSRHRIKKQVNTCDSLAVATAGSVALTDVALIIEQDGRGRYRSNSADVNIQGGDAEALSACLQVLKAKASRSQENTCSSTAIATGGDVILDDVTIVVTQG